MNLRTTIVLGILLLLGLAGWLAFLWMTPTQPTSETLVFLDGLKAKDLERIEVRRGDKTLVVLTRAADGWRLPGNWPIRDKEVEELVHSITHLGSRFAPTKLPDDKAAADKELEKLGLDASALKVTLRVKDKPYTLTLGQGGTDQFAAPTHLRLDDQNEVVRLGPNLIAQLDHPADYYQKRQLFASERIAKDEKGREKEDRLVAKGIRIAGPEDAVRLAKTGDDWEMTEPKDRADPDKIKTLLNKATDIWAETFVDAETVQKKFERWPAPVTGLAPLLTKHDFYASQALWVAADSVAAAARGESPFALATQAFLAGQALPDYVVEVTRPDGVALTLYVGGVASESTRKTMRTISTPKGPMSFPEEVTERRRYARVEDPTGEKKLEEMPLFEVKADLLTSLPASRAELRDPNILRFRTDNARRLEIFERQDKEYAKTLAFEKAKEGDGKKDDAKKEDGKKDDDLFKDLFKKDEVAREVWRLRAPSDEIVEREPLDKLLSELADLQSRGDDVAYPRADDLARFGLDRPAFKVKLTYEEEPKEKKKDKKAGKDKEEKKVTRDVVLLIGGMVKSKVDKAKKETKGKDKEDEKDKEEKKVYVQLEGWPRVSAVSDKLLELVSRPVYAYRGRKLLDLAQKDIEKIEIERAKDALVLARRKEGWGLETPAKAEAEEKKIEPLVRRLSALEAVEFIADKPGKEDLEKKYGLLPPQATVKLHLKEDKADDKKPAAHKERVLQVGKQRPDRPDYYARLDDGPVFVLDKEVAGDLLRDSLAYRSLAVWQLDEINEVDIQGKEKPYQLVRADKKWKIAGPIDAPASAEAEGVAGFLGHLRAVRFVDHIGADLAKYGLKEPHLKVTVKAGDKDKKEKTLLIGAPVEPGSAERFAKVDKEDGVFVLAPTLFTVLERTAYDWLDRVLLAVNPALIQSIEAAGKSTFLLRKKSGEWEVSKSPAPTFTAEEAAVQAFLAPWRPLEAERVAATGKIDWAKYGLEPPALTLTVTENLPAGKPIEHVLALGGDAGKGERYARMDKADFVAVLAPAVVKALEKSHVDFLPTGVMKYTITDLTGLTRTMAGADVSIVKRGDSWQLDKPYDRPADDILVGEIMEATFRLRAVRIAAYPAKDLAPFGLDKPAAAWKFQLTDPTGVTAEETLLIGGPTGKDEGEHFAMKAKDDKVFVLPAELSRTLLAKPLSFADRNVTTLVRADQAVLDRGKRHAVFTKVGADWKMTGPVEAKAEEADLENFLKELTRLRAEIVEAKPSPENLKKFGLEKAEATWTFRLGDKQVLKLALGDLESPKATRRYARIEGNENVYLLPPKLSQQALGEYRERKALEGFDAVKAQELRVVGPGTSYRLRKREDAWTLLEEPDKKVDTKALTDTLDALAGLKVVRYLTDVKDAEQDALTGLGKAEWTIELRSEKQSFTLAVGRTVEGGKDRYARVDEGPAIFILSEADLARLLKPAAAFLTPAGKGEEKKGEEKKDKE